MRATNRALNMRATYRAQLQLITKLNERENWCCQPGRGTSLDDSHARQRMGRSAVAKQDIQTNSPYDAALGECDVSLGAGVNEGRRVLIM